MLPCHQVLFSSCHLVNLWVFRVTDVAQEYRRFWTYPGLIVFFTQIVHDIILICQLEIYFIRELLKIVHHRSLHGLHLGDQGLTRKSPKRLPLIGSRGSRRDSHYNISAPLCERCLLLLCWRSRWSGQGDPPRRSQWSGQWGRPFHPSEAAVLSAPKVVWRAGRQHALSEVAIDFSFTRLCTFSSVRGEDEIQRRMAGTSGQIFEIEAGTL